MTFSTKLDVPWGKYEAGVHSEDTKTQIEQTDKFLAEREHALETDPKIKQWEEDRKKAWEKDKPTWKKKQMSEEKEVSAKLVRDLKTGGSYDMKLKPSAGYLIVEVKKPEEKTATGIFLAQEALQILQNTGVVVEVGKATKDIEPPCIVGDVVMFKKGAGMEIGIEGKDCQMMTFSDILGVFYD
jgi:co-chaperonin GroES (HSP10)